MNTTIVAITLGLQCRDTTHTPTGLSVLRTDHLTVSADTRDGRPLIAGLSLTVGRGEAISVTGPSGCGKSTLLRSIAGLIDPVAGAVTLHGKTPGETGWPDFRRRVCLLPQRPTLTDHSIESNFVRPFCFRSAVGRFDPDRARALVERVGLGDAIGRSAAKLSEGQQQRVCLVRALLIDPDVLLLDEPTSALDGEAARRVELLLAGEMTGRGLGVLIATHDPAQAQRLCTRVIDLTPWRVTEEATDA